MPGHTVPPLRRNPVKAPASSLNSDNMELNNPENRQPQSNHLMESTLLLHSDNRLNQKAGRSFRQALKQRLTQWISHSPLRHYAPRSVLQDIAKPKARAKMSNTNFKASNSDETTHQAPTHRITACAPYEALWRNHPTPEGRVTAANNVIRNLNEQIYGEQGAGKLNLTKNVDAEIAQLREQHGSVRLVIGVQRAPECVDAGSSPFIWDPYYTAGLQRAEAGDFSINTDLTANPNLWGDPADAATMSRIADNTFDQILIEAVPIQAVSRHGDRNTEWLAAQHHQLQAGVAQGTLYTSVVKNITEYKCRREGLAAWHHMARVLQPGGELTAKCQGHMLINRQTAAEVIQAAQDSGLVIESITLRKSAVIPAFSLTSVVIGPDLSSATVFVQRDGLFKTREYESTGPWQWYPEKPLPHFARLLRMTDTGADALDIFDSISLVARKPSSPPVSGRPGRNETTNSH